MVLWWGATGCFTATSGKSKLCNTFFARVQSACSTPTYTLRPGSSTRSPVKEVSTFRCNVSNSTSQLAATRKVSLNRSFH